MKRIIPFRWLRILIWLFIILAIIWTAVWFAASNWLDNKVSTITTSLGDRGTNIECANRSVTGFPFSMMVNCEKISVETVRGTERADAGAMSFGASVFEPDVLVSQLKSPFVTYAGGKKIQADWSRLQTKIDGNIQGGFDSIELRGNRFTLDRDDFKASIKSQLASVSPVLWNNKKDTEKTSMSLRFSATQFEMNVADGVTIPPVDIRGYAVLQDGYLDVVERRLPIRALLADGASIRLTNLILSLEGGGQLGFSGPIVLSKDGLISGKVRMGINGPEAVAAWASRIDPNLQQAVAGLAQATSGMGKLSKIGGKDMRTISVKIKRGEVRLGFIKLGKIPPLRFKQ